MKEKSIRTLLLSVCLTLTLFSASNINAQNKRGVGIKVKGKNGQTKEVQLYDGSYALIIGNSEYSNGWDRLSGVKADVIAVRNILKRHGFKVETEVNLTSDRFETRISKFVKDYGFNRNNRLIIYYAGHGYTLKSAGDKRELGYIIPSDTPLPNKDKLGFRRKAIDMYTMQTFAKRIQAKHALFIFDSCFSGKLFALRNTLKISPFIYEKINYPVRQFITAGDETQTVPDESIFRKAFVRGLEGEADRNSDKYITGTELADYLKEKVTNYSNRLQTPQYGLINDIELDRGDFVFNIPSLNLKIKKKKFRGVALVFGNGAYLNASKLVNPINDATDMRKAFESLGFEVILGGIDTTKKEMDQLIKQFGQKLKKSQGTGVFFYAGHGFVIDNVNYLLPIDFQMPKLSDAKSLKQSLLSQSIDVERILLIMSEATKEAKIMIIDTQLNNPFNYGENRNESLAYLSRMPNNSFVAYSTKVGETAMDGSGNNSPYVEEISSKILNKNLELKDMFRKISNEVEKNYKQSPWFLSTLNEKFYFGN